LKALIARRARFERRIEFLKAMILKLLEHAGLKKIELPEATLSAHSGAPRVLGSADPDTLPDVLCKITREPNLTKIKERLQEGGEVPGYVLSNAEPHLVTYR
jgi:hypothetical protein